MHQNACRVYIFPAPPVPAAAHGCCCCRGDLQPGESLEDFNPTYLRKRQPSLALVALFAILDPPR